MTHLIAYIDGNRVGSFTQDRHGQIRFTYDDDLALDQTPLSVAMPLVPGASFKNAITKPFLQGLLPDNTLTLETLAAKYDTSASNPMKLLEHVGRDTAGALQLLPPGVDSDDAARRTGEVEIVEDFDGLIAEIVKDAAAWQRDRHEIRWSLAGVQPKVALYLTDDGQWAVPLDSTPTTHILKPAATGTRHDLNEFLTMRAAKHLGLLVADHQILTTELGDHVFVSKRYDRVPVGGVLRRLHQEDFAQALSVSPARKYQVDGGPALGDFRSVFDAFPPSVTDQARRDFFDGLIYTIASINTDAHSKNYSVLHFGRQMSMAPLSDLGTNVLYDGNRTLDTAISVGGEKVMDRIGIRHFKDAARVLRLDWDTAEERVHHIRREVAEAFLQARQDMLDQDRGLTRLDEDGKKYLSEIVDGIAENSRLRGWA
ncbi:MAG: HipA domain-containing protein [Leifsonia sp.]